MKKTIVVFILMAVCGLAQAQNVQVNVNKDNRTIAITTTDDASAVADIAVVSVGFETYGSDSQQTYADAGTTSNAIMKALLDAGVKKEAIESTEQGIHSLGDDDKLRVSKGLKFRFAQTWSVTVAAKDAATVLHLAINAGANDSGNIQWKLSSVDLLEAEAAQKALGHAREVAEHMAKGLNAKLGPLVYASNQTPPRGILAALAMGGMTLQTESAALGGRIKRAPPVVITPEKISRSATVYAVFAIE